MPLRGSSIERGAGQEPSAASGVEQDAVKGPLVFWLFTLSPFCNKFQKEAALANVTDSARSKSDRVKIPLVCLRESLPPPDEVRELGNIFFFLFLLVKESSVENR